MNFDCCFDVGGIGHVLKNVILFKFTVNFIITTNSIFRNKPEKCLLAIDIYRIFEYFLNENRKTMFC